MSDEYYDPRPTGRIRRDIREKSAEAYGADHAPVGGSRPLRAGDFEYIVAALGLEVDGYRKAHFMAAVLDAADSEYDPLTLGNNLKRRQLLDIERLLEEEADGDAGP